MRLFCILGILLLNASCYGQIKVKNFHFSAGPMAYSGDLSHNYDNWSPSIEIGLGLSAAGKISKSVALLVAQYSGNSNTHINNQYFFKSALIGLHHHFGYTKKFRGTQFSLESGPGIIYFNPTDEFGTSLSTLDIGKIANENYRNISISLDSKLSAIYYLNKTMGIKISGGFLLPFSDYIDNISEAANSINRDNLLRFNVGLITGLL